MAGSRTGTPSIWRHSKKIQQLAAKYGAGDLSAKFGPEFAACVTALVNCVVLIYSTDNAPGEVDRIPPAGPEDPA